ncbi:MAG: endolytic transglycosylase MltG [Lachnospiraceae bacterium]|nr:endolytic transglycosylase MltG [Lachnospiraceae bacterium]
MKGKYFLRGLGLGIFVTALILAIAFAFYEPEISRADIEKQARALGMEYTDLTAKAVDERDSLEGSEEESEESEEDASKSGEQSSKKQDSDDDSVDTGDTAETSESEAGSEDAEIIKPEDTKKNPDPVQKQEDTTVKTSETPSTDYKSTESKTESKTPETKTATDSTDRADDKSGAEKLISFTISSGQSSEVVSANLYKAGIISDPNEFNHYLEQNGYDAKIHTGSFNISSDSSFEQIANAIAY